MVASEEANGGSQPVSPRQHHDEGWDACLRLLEPHEKKMLQKASDEFNLGAMLSSLQDCVQPHLVWEICCRQDSTLTQACQKVGIQAERKTLENGYDILSPSTANKLKHEFDRNRPHRLWWSLKCGEWYSTPKVNQRSETQRLNFRKRRMKARRGVRHALGVIEYALDKDPSTKFYWEWPKSAFAGWHLFEIRAFLARLRTKGIKIHWTEIDGCHFDTSPPHGGPNHNAWWVMSNDADFDAKCTFQCDRTHEHCTGETAGMETRAVRATGFYPPAMCLAIAKVWNSQWQQALRKMKESDIIESMHILESEAVFAGQTPHQDDISKEKKEKAEALLHRLHKAAGHPTNAALARMLRDRNSPKWMVDMAKELKCQACIDIQRGEQLIVPYSLGAKPAPWQIVAADTFELTFPLLRKKVRFLLMSCVTMRFVSVIQLWEGPVGEAGTDSGKRLAEALVEGWLLHRPKPQWVIVDPQTSLATGDFVSFLQGAGIGVSVTPGEAHWQNGLIESLIRVIKTTMRKIRGEQPLLDPRAVAQLAVHSHNQHSRVKGYSPMQWAYGTDFKQDSLEVEPEEYNAATHRIPRKFWDIQKNRELAERHWREAQAQEAMTRLRNASPRPVREFQVGEWVCVWRTSIWRTRKGSVNPEPRYVGPGRVVFTEPAILQENKGQVIWVLMGTQVWRCAPEQLRRASPQEITLEEVTNGRRYSAPITELVKQSTKVIDVLKEPGFPFQEERLPEHPLPGPQPGPSEQDGRSQLPDEWMKDVTDRKDRWTKRQLQKGMQDEKQETVQERTLRWRQLVSLNENRRREGLPPVTSLPPLAPDIKEQAQTQFFALAGEADAPITMETYSAVVEKITQLERELKFLDERQQLLEAIEAESREENKLKNLFLKACDNREEVCEIIFEIEDWREFCRGGAVYTKQAIASTKEVNFKNLSPQHKKLMEEAMARELNEVIRSQALRALKERVPEEVLTQRCIPMRWILTWKPLDEFQDPEREPQPGIIREDGFAKAKARIVLIGYKHPDLAKRDPRTGKPLLQTSSPTLSRLGRNLLLQSAALDGHILECADAKSAFLQTEEGIGTKDLFTRGVEEVRIALGLSKGEAMQVVGAVYGLTNAPRIFWRDADSKLQALGFTPHAIDKCVWLYKNSEGQVIGRIGAHVDDFLIMGDHTSTEWLNVRAKIFDMYQWSPWKRGSFTFAGVQLHQLQDYTIVMSQEQFCNQLQPVKIENERSRAKDDALTPKELSQTRGFVMQAQWRAIQTAPQYCCRIGLASSSLTKPTLSNLREANAIVKELKKSSTDSLIFHSFVGEDRNWKNMVFLHFGDAAQRNRPDGSDTGGYITAISTSRILEGRESRTSIVDYRSFKLDRPSRGSNGAEGQAIFECEDKGWKARLFWSILYGEVLNRTNSEHLASLVESLLIMDSRGCFDALSNSDSPLLGMSNAKTGVEMMSVQRGVRDESNCYLTWVPSDVHLSDCMTTVTPEAFKTYMLWQQRKTWSIRFDDEFVSARKQQKLRRTKSEQDQVKNAPFDPWPDEYMEASKECSLRMVTIVGQLANESICEYGVHVAVRSFEHNMLSTRFLRNAQIREV